MMFTVQGQELTRGGGLHLSTVIWNNVQAGHRFDSGMSHYEGDVSFVFNFDPELL
jgi:hypothetical protein